MINTKDPQWRVCDEFQPDKEETWTTPLEKDGWIFAHNALRSEMKLMREALEAISKRNTGVNAWEIRAIRTASSAHLEHMKWHADNEDVNIMPELRKRFKFPVRHKPCTVR